jgi:hypothetical protein
MGRHPIFNAVGVVSYLLGALACFFWLLWPNFEGHADAPLSSFPSSLIFFPMAPFAAMWLVPVAPKAAIVGIVVFIAAALMSFRVLDAIVGKPKDNGRG